MNHPSPDELRGFLNDSIEESLDAKVAQHLESCLKCRQTIEQMIGQPAASLWSLQNRSNESTVPSGNGLSRQFDSFSQQNLELRFVLGEEIARGGMGIVYRGFDREFKREVSNKVALENQTALTIRFAREAEIAGQLQHPGVVPVYQMGRLDDGRFYMAMRLVQGQTLLSLLGEENEKQSLAANLEVFGQICQTMAYAHSRDFVHRDLKPANVMVGSFGEVQIMDWGLAKKISDDDETWSNSERDTVVAKSSMETVPGQVMGTPAYMAPEQAKGETTTKRTDVFALGGILFQILTGKAPFDESTTSRAIAKSANASLTDAFSSLDLSGVDQSLIEIVKSCLDPDPSQRPKDAKVVNQRFSQYIADREQERQDSKLAEARVKERLIAQQKRNRQLVWSAGAIVAALAISAAAGFMYLREKNTRIANQAKVDREHIETTLRDEQKIREILKTAAEHERLAAELDPVHQSEQWILAKKEIEKTGAILSDRIDPALLESCDVAGKRILDATERSIRVKTNHETELACLEKVRLHCEESFYTDDIKQAVVREQSIPAELAAIYREIGVAPDSDFDFAVERIAKSNLKTELLLGLMVWQRELQNLSSERAPADDTSSSWLGRLISASDTDRFRTKVRAVALQQDVDELAKLVESDQATVSRLNVYSVVNQFSRLSIETATQLPYLRRAKERFPEDFLTNWHHAVALPASDDRRNECALTCCTLRPGNVAALWMLGKTSVAQADYSQAVDALKKLVYGTPDFANGHVQLAIALGKTGQSKSAIEHFNSALDLEPNSPAVFRHRGELYLNTKKFSAATSDLLKFRKLQPNDSSVDELIFKNYEQAGQSDEAIEALNHIIKKNPKVEKNYEKLWVLYEKLMERHLNAGHNQSAKDAIANAAANFVELTRLFPDFHSPHETLAKHYEYRSDFYSAIRSLRTAIQRLPAESPKAKELTQLMANLARRVYELSFPDSERKNVIGMLIEVASFIETRNPNFKELPELYVVLGRLFQQNGQLEKAIEATEKAYAAQQRTPYDAYRVEMITTGVPAVNKVLESLGLPSAVVTKREPVRSDKALLRLHNPRAVSSLAMLLMQQNNPKKSEAMVRTALEHTPDSPLLKLVLAKSLAMQSATKPDEKQRAEILNILRQLEFPDNPFQLSR